MTIHVISRSGDSTRSTKGLKLAPLMLLASTCLLSACGSSGGTDAASALKSSKSGVNSGKGGGPTTPTPTPAPTPTPTTTSTATYDASIGNGVDANGFADLPLRSGAHRYFVSSATGSDSNGCGAGQQAATPLKSIAAAMTCVQDGSGDQVLVAQGTRYSESLPNFNGRGGFSPLYPTVIESYDPSDPTNEAKYGRAASPNRPVISSAPLQYITSRGGAFTNSPKYIAIRGFDLNPGNVAGPGITFIPNNTGTNDYVLIENNLFRYTSLGADQAMASTRANHLIIRNNSFYGQWMAGPNAGGGHVSGMYIDNWDNVTLEDNVFWHNGWEVGVSRDADTSVGGLGGDEVFRHTYYLQESTSATIRRNLIIDGPADCGTARGDLLHTENVLVDCPIAIDVGGGDQYSVARPNGVSLEVSYNAVIGDADITSSFPRRWGIRTLNGKQGSSAHNNLLVQSSDLTAAAANGAVFSTEARYNQPSYMDWHDNLAYRRVPSGRTHFDNGGAYGTTQVFTSYETNLWDDPTLGTNANDASKSFPNPYTAAQLYVALGFADKQGFITYAIEHPEVHVQRSARQLLFTGYGMN